MKTSFTNSLAFNFKHGDAKLEMNKLGTYSYVYYTSLDSE